MTEEQARQIYKEKLQKARENSQHLCDSCPYKWTDPQEACTFDQCVEQHFVVGCLEGYNKALEDLKAPKTLAENRD